MGEENDREGVYKKAQLIAQLMEREWSSKRDSVKSRPLRVADEVGIDIEIQMMPENS